jgi:opacity protein-like surface antigen
MLRTTIALGPAALVLTVVGSATAATPSAALRDGNIIISADRLAPIVDYWSSTTTDTNGSKSTSSRTSISLVTSNPLAALGTVYNVPRFGLDGVIGPGVTIGGAAWIYTDLNASNSTTPANGGSSTSFDQPKATYWGVAPRVGYILAIGDMVSLWPRAGVEYHDVSSGTVTNNGNTSGGSSFTQLALDVDALLVITPVNHFGITIGPGAAIPLTGNTSSTSTIAGQTTTTSRDSAMWWVGLNAGLLGYF